MDDKRDQLIKYHEATLAGAIPRKDHGEVLRATVEMLRADDAQAERIKALEAKVEAQRKSESNLSHIAVRIGNRSEHVIETAKRAIATAIARFAVTYAAETQSDAGQSVKVVGLEQILQVCHSHGAVLEDPNGQ